MKALKLPTIFHNIIESTSIILLDRWQLFFKLEITLFYSYEMLLYELTEMKNV